MDLSKITRPGEGYELLAGPCPVCGAADRFNAQAPLWLVVAWMESHTCRPLPRCEIRFGSHELPFAQCSRRRHDDDRHHFEWINTPAIDEWEPEQ